MGWEEIGKGQEKSKFGLETNYTFIGDVKVSRTLLVLMSLHKAPGYYYSLQQLTSPSFLTLLTIQIILS